MSSFNSGSLDDEEASSLGLNKNPRWLAGGAIALVIVAIIALVYAEGRHSWQLAQVSAAIVLLTLSSLAWGWWEKSSKPRHYSITAHVYHRAMRKLLWCDFIGINALMLNGIRIERWPCGLVAQALGYGMLVAGASFISGIMFGYLFGLRPSGQQQTADGGRPRSQCKRTLKRLPTG